MKQFTLKKGDLFKFKYPSVKNKNFIFLINIPSLGLYLSWLNTHKNNASLDMRNKPYEIIWFNQKKITLETFIILGEATKLKEIMETDVELFPRQKKETWYKVLYKNMVCYGHSDVLNETNILILNKNNKQ